MNKVIARGERDLREHFAKEQHLFGLHNLADLWAHTLVKLRLCSLELKGAVGPVGYNVPASLDKLGCRAGKLKQKCIYHRVANELTIERVLAKRGLRNKLGHGKRQADRELDLSS